MKQSTAFGIVAATSFLALTCLACKKGGEERSETKAAVRSEAEIKIGQTMPYSGPASSYGTVGKLQAAYFKKLNAKGGVGGHKINFITVDDGYSPPKTVEQTRKLVEQEQVLLVFQPLGTAPNAAIQDYLQTKKVPQLFVATGATRWGDPEHHPWTMGFNPSYQLEGSTIAKHLMSAQSGSKIAVLYQNDDYGKDYLKGLKAGLADKAKMIVAEATYEVSDATVDSQIATLKGSGADTFVNITTPKFGAQAIRKAYDIGWKPTHYLSNVSASVGTVLTPAGLDKSVGLVTVAYYKDPTDKQWNDDPAMKEFITFMKEDYPEGSLSDSFHIYAYIAAQTMVQVLTQCGADLSRENIMKQAANLDFAPGLLLPGIRIKTSPTDFFPVEQLRLVRFDGKDWVLFGDVLSAN
ncbi:ABC transporter substrate-binding protein [Pendulispora rubella]|uniref:ABC transporter substrate-binding protein n=1 Tax=Pendulispora rubella TaxID=2741070 RepID=A0ABZ2LNH4_9BACT